MTDRPVDASSYELVFSAVLAGASGLFVGAVAFNGLDAVSARLGEYVPAEYIAAAFCGMGVAFAVAAAVLRTVGLRGSRLWERAGEVVAVVVLVGWLLVLFG